MAQTGFRRRLGQAPVRLEACFTRFAREEIGNVVYFIHRRPVEGAWHEPQET